MSYINPCLRGGGGWCKSCVFLKWLLKCWADCAEILHSSWGILCEDFVEKVTRSSQVTELWHLKRYSLQLIFQGNCVFIGNFADEGYAVPFSFRDAMHHKYSINKLQQHLILFRIGWGTHWWRCYVASIYGFGDICLISSKTVNLEKIDIWHLKTGSNIGLGSKNAPPIVSTQWGQSQLGKLRGVDQKNRSIKK